MEDFAIPRNGDGHFLVVEVENPRNCRFEFHCEVGANKMSIKRNYAH